VALSSSQVRTSGSQPEDWGSNPHSATKPESDDTGGIRTIHSIVFCVLYLCYRMWG
jgi:hypothetical protein